nr:MAG TPA: tail protein [Caudoviricetes sp.]
MVLTIYDKAGKRRTELSPNDSSTQTKEIGGDNVLTLSFTLYEHMELDVDDYTDYEGERYWLTERYRPKQKSTKEWSYDLTLYGIESLIRNILVIKRVDGEDDPVFTLTAPPREHVAMIVNCMNDGMGNVTDWKVGQVDGAENIVIDYFGKYCDEALKEIAEKVGAEWWVEGQTINVCRCEHGEPITLGYNKGLLSIDPGKADNVKFYTRLWPVGSSRNIDAATYGHSRLQLPDGKRYVEVNADKYGRVDHYEAEAFADIYPRRTGTISSVRSEVKKGEDGNDFTIYYFKDNNLPFSPNEYEIGGLVKRVSFQEGSELGGLGDEEDGTYYFEVNYDDKTEEFEIITIWPYDNDMQLPGGSLVPKVGDKYILWNIRMPEEYYRIAEEEFGQAVDKYNQEHALDVSVFKSSTDHVWVENEAADLYVGRRVHLESKQYFPETGYRDSRITKITRKVNLPSSLELEIGDTLGRTAREKMGDDIKDARGYAQSIGASVALPDIIRTWDKTLPTDNNLFSSRRSQREFLNKNARDRAKKKITFEEGADFGNYKRAATGGTIDGAGNAELQTLLVRALLGSPKFASGMSGEGWRISLENGFANLTIDTLTVRRIMTVFEMLVEKVRSVGGQICVSAANGKIKKVRKTGGYYVVTFEQENTFKPHDLMRCQTFTGGGAKEYWVEIATVDGYSVTVAEDEFAGAEPIPGDECVLMGNTENPDRQNLILISATEDGQPRIDVLDGVTTKSFDGSLRTRLGSLDGITDHYFSDDNQPHGNGLYSDNAYLRGTFLLATGEDVKTMFEVVEGRISSAVEGLRQDMSADVGYLNNPAFLDGIAKWNTSGNAVFFLAGNRWLLVNGGVLSKKGDGVSIIKDGERTVVRLRNKWIKQTNGNMRSKPTFEANSAGICEAVPVYLGFFYKCTKPGTLKIRFENVDKTGFANFDPMEVEEALAATDGYAKYTCDGLWNGTGDFILSFTGEIYLYMLVLSTDKVDSLTYKYRTLFEQSEKLVKIAAQNFDKDGNVLEESAIITEAKYNLLISAYFDENGKLINSSGLVTTANFANMFASAVNESGLVKKADITTFVTEDDVKGMISGIKLSADQITLEGLVTANGNFKILSDGSIEAKNGTFSGSIKTYFVNIENSDATVSNGDNYLLNNDLKIISEGCGETIILPTNVKYIGCRVLICNPKMYWSRTDQTTKIKTQNNSPIYGMHPTDQTSPTDNMPLGVSSFDFLTGVVELVGLPGDGNNTRWYVLSASAHYIYAYAPEN